MQGRAFCCCYIKLKGAWIAPLVEQQTFDQRVVGSVPSRSGGRFFFSPELTFCADSYSMSVPLLCSLPQWHIKDPGHSAKSAGGRLQINRHAHFTQ